MGANKDIRKIILVSLLLICGQKMSQFEHLTEPNKLLPGLKTMFAERGRIKQTISNVQSVVKEGSLGTLA